MLKQPKLPKESLLLTGAFLIGLGFVCVLTRKRGLLSLEPNVVMPISDIGWPTRPILTFNYVRSSTHTHQGVDIIAPTGTPIFAAKGGRVTHALFSTRPGFSGYGRMVVIEGEPIQGVPSLWYMYAHMDEVYVTAGQYVKTGEQIGTVGRTCFRVEDPTRMCGGSHLHFEVSPRSYPQDSEAWRYSPEQIINAIATGITPNTWITT